MQLSTKQTNNQTTDQAKLTQWGNSQGIRLSKEIIRKANIHDNQQFKIEVADDGSILLEPFQTEPTSAKELFAGWKDDGVRDSELDWGPKQGNELQW